MFDIGWSELLVIAVVAIIVVGPRDLPGMLRTFGRHLGKMKRMASEFQTQFNDALKEAELDTLKKDVEQLAEMNPIRDFENEVRKEMEPVAGIGDDIRKSVEAPQAAKTPVPAKASEPAKAEPAGPKASDGPKASATPRPKAPAKSASSAKTTAKAGGDAA